MPDSKITDWGAFKDWLDVQFGSSTHWGEFREREWYDYWTAVGKPNTRVNLTTHTISGEAATTTEDEGFGPPGEPIRPIRREAATTQGAVPTRVLPDTLPGSRHAKKLSYRGAVPTLQGAGSTFRGAGPTLQSKTDPSLSQGPFGGSLASLVRPIMQQYGVDFKTAMLIYRGWSPTDATVEARFSAWLGWQVDRGVYSSSAANSILADPESDIREHYKENVLGTQWDIAVTRASEFGLLDTEWSILMRLPEEDEEVTAQLEQWIEIGRIDQSQAYRIWEELPLRHSRLRAEARRNELFRLGQTGGLEDPGDRERRLEREAEEEKRLRAKQYTDRIRYTNWGGERPPEPFTEFGTAEEFRAGFDIPQTDRAISWFRSRFPRLIEQFKEKYLGLEQGAQTWQQFLEGRTPQIREEFARLSPFERGERPSAFAPRVTTVRF